MGREDGFFEALRQWRERAASEGKRLRFKGMATLAQREDLWRETAADHPGEIHLTLNLPGLFGAFGTLPDYFTGEVVHDGEEDRAFRDFLDLFNHRFFETLFLIWRRYHLFSQDLLDPPSERAAEEARKLDRLAGFLDGGTHPAYLRGLRWHRMSLFHARHPTALGVCELVRAFFPNLEVSFTSFIATYRAIPPRQRAELGAKPLQIGRDGNALVGSKFKDLCGGYRLTFSGLDYESYIKCLPGGVWYALLNQVLNGYTRGRWECHLRLVLRREEIPGLRLGARRLGTDMWVQSLPPVADAAVDAGVMA